MAARIRYGITPWGSWFAEALDDFDESGRLSRGKSYANTGKVASIDFEGRSALAKVKGHSRPWYKVRIDFPPLGAAAASKLFALIEAEPLLLSRIESGELPEELLGRLKAAKIDLIPRAWSSMKRSCDCPDWGDPCKHMAAVYYLVAREIDRDPGLLFRLRGVDLAERFGRVAKSRPLPSAFPVETVAAPPPSTPAEAPEPPRLQSYLGFVTSLIPPRPPFAREDFGAALVEFYHRAAALGPAAGQDGVKRGGVEPTSALERRFSSSGFRAELEGASRGALAPGSVSLAGGRAIYVVETGADRKERKMPASAALALFLDFEDERGTPSYRFLFYLARLAFAAWHASAFVPAPVLEGEELGIAWIPLPAAKELSGAIDELGSYDPGIFRIGGARKGGSLLSGGCAARALIASCLGDWTRRLEFRPSGERADLRPMVDLFFAGGRVDASAPGERGLAAAIASWLSIFNLDFSSSKYRYRFEIAGADKDSPAQDDDGPAIRRFSLGLSVLAAQPEGGRARAVALADAAKRLGDLEVLRIPTALAAYVPEIRTLASRRRIILEEPRLAAFLGEASSVLGRLGVEVVLPKALRTALVPRLVLKVERKSERSLKSYLDLDSVLAYDWRIAIGDRLLSPAAFERLVRQKRELVLFHEGFVRLDADEAARLLERARSKREPSALDLLAARFGGDALFSADAEEVASSLFEPRDEALPAGLAATLRPYQERGYRWIMANLRSGFGCLLADDMGLGKTVQAIAVMLRLEEEGCLDRGALVVAPAALLTNWERELGRFAPGLLTVRYHGSGRRLSEGARVFLTTYDTAARDAERLAEHGFSLLVCDEAQLMKNARARRSLGVKAIAAERRFALSGTPVENRLEDLRSIFDFVLPGYLGGAAEFKSRWRVPIELERDAACAEKLRRISSPFLMRRLKTDRDIVPDLPDKIVTDEYARLETEQAALYASVVREGMAEAERAEPGFERAAVVLKLLTALKQVCDHPRVYDRESPPEARLSGKCLLLLELLREVLERREKVLVFSQYVETLKLLETLVQAELGERALLYHGGMGKKARDRAVDSFQNDGASRVMLVSLKAGGLGLNLTAASRVVHYDLWYNPAVENQATDRAFRIGQTRNVFVHRLITAGTFEEKIDAMIKGKRELAEMSVASGESWIAKLSAEELRELFSI